MREIKFRAWDIRDREYEYIDDFYWFEERAIHDLSDERYYIFEQYTGLKDKNGREIYEGDIIYTQHRIISEQHPLAVVWDNDYSRFCVTHPELRGGSASLGNLNPRFWAVIGNIHENAALLGHTPGPSAE